MGTKQPHICPTRFSIQLSDSLRSIKNEVFLFLDFQLLTSKFNLLMNQLSLVLRHAEYQARDMGAKFGVYGRKNRPRGPTEGGDS
jgi:hypothetical protein